MLTDKELAAVPEELLEDLLRYFPRDYEDRRKIWSIRSAPLVRKNGRAALQSGNCVL